MMAAEKTKQALAMRMAKTMPVTVPGLRASALRAGSVSCGVIAALLEADADTDTESEPVRIRNPDGRAEHVAEYTVFTTLEVAVAAVPLPLLLGVDDTKLGVVVLLLLGVTDGGTNTTLLAAGLSKFSTLVACTNCRVHTLPVRTACPNGAPSG
jgi:hypothetical protein